MTHVMTLVTTYPTGAEDWLCPECGYRFVMRWQPFRRVCLVEGDQAEPHSGQRGGLVMGGVEVEPRQELDMNVWGAVNDDNTESVGGLIDLFDEFNRTTERAAQSFIDFSVEIDAIQRTREYRQYMIYDLYFSMYLSDN